MLINPNSFLFSYANYGGENLVVKQVRCEKLRLELAFFTESFAVHQKKSANFALLQDLLLEKLFCTYILN